MVASLTSLCWELSRPDTVYETEDVTDKLAPEDRLIIKQMMIHMVIGEDGNPIMAWGSGDNHSTKGMPQPEKFGPMIDAFIDERWGHLDLSTVQSMRRYDRLPKTPPTTAYVDVSKEAIDKAVEQFSDEFDRIFSVWEGGEDE